MYWKHYVIIDILNVSLPIIISWMDYSGLLFLALGGGCMRCRGLLAVDRILHYSHTLARSTEVTNRILRRLISLNLRVSAAPLVDSVLCNNNSFFTYLHLLNNLFLSLPLFLGDFGLHFAGRNRVQLRLALWCSIGCFRDYRRLSYFSWK